MTYHDNKYGSDSDRFIQPNDLSDLERYKQQVASFKTKKSLDNLEARLTAMEQRLDFMLEKIEKLIKDFNV